MIWLFVLYAISGFTITLSKILLTYASPFFLIGSRMVIAGLGLGAYARLQGISITALSLEDWWLIAQFAFFGVIVPAITRVWALQYLPAVKIALLFNITPFFSALIAYYLLKERLSFLQLLGLCAGFSGLIPLMLVRQAQGIDQLLMPITLPDFILLASVVSFSYSLFIMQKLVRHRAVSPLLANGFSMLLAGVFSYNLSFAVEPIWLKGDCMLFLSLLALNIVLSNVICAHLQATILKTYSSTTMTFTSFLTPVFAAFYGWCFFGEQVSMNMLIAAGLILSGLMLYFFEHLQAIVANVYVKAQKEPTVLS